MTVRRECLRDPVPDIAVAARLLSEAADAHVAGNRSRVLELLAASNLSTVREWVESLWGAKSKYLPATLVPSRGGGRQALRMPDSATRQQLLQRDGHHCRYCGIPLVRAEVRKFLCVAYPEASLWGRRNVDQHAGLQAMWVQFDHVVPHSAGGDNTLDNLVVTCGPCNFAKMQYTIEQLNLLDPRDRPPVRSNWDGLERVLTHRAVK